MQFVYLRPPISDVHPHCQPSFSWHKYSLPPYAEAFLAGKSTIANWVRWVPCFMVGLAVSNFDWRARWRKDIYVLHSFSRPLLCSDWGRSQWTVLSKLFLSSNALVVLQGAPVLANSFRCLGYAARPCINALEYLLSSFLPVPPIHMYAWNTNAWSWYTIVLYYAMQFAWVVNGR